MPQDEVLDTQIQKVNSIFVAKRIELINEAILYEGGSIGTPLKHVISSLPNGKESYFHKPGKETLRKKPNVHDMSVNIGAAGNNEVENWQFEKIWEYLIKISIINQITFKKILVLLYRNCYFLDHMSNADGKLRYSPSNELLEYIYKIEFSIKDGFKDKFNTEEIGLLEYIHFVDLLGWNEDVKYHIKDSKPDFVTVDKKTGRVNTIQSIIGAPIMISNFINDIINKTNTNGVIDVKLITSTIQKFTISRGICVLPNKELVIYLAPYLKV